MTTQEGPIYKRTKGFHHRALAFTNQSSTWKNTKPTESSVFRSVDTEQGVVTSHRYRTSTTCTDCKGSTLLKWRPFLTAPNSVFRNDGEPPRVTTAYARVSSRRNQDHRPTSHIGSHMCHKRGLARLLKRTNEITMDESGTSASHILTCEVFTKHLKSRLPSPFTTNASHKHSFWLTRRSPFPIDHLFLFYAARNSDREFFLPSRLPAHREALPSTVSCVPTPCHSRFAVHSCIFLTGYPNAPAPSSACARQPSWAASHAPLRAPSPSARVPPLPTPRLLHPFHPISSHNRRPPQPIPHPFPPRHSPRVCPSGTSSGCDWQMSPPLPLVGWGGREVAPFAVIG